MKKTIFFLVILVLGMVSCDRKPKDNSQNGADIVVVDHGKLLFYDLKAKKLAPYENEPDSVLNAVFDLENHLYYTVSKNEKLFLKMLDMNQEKPSPVLCADWEVALDDAIDYMYGEVSHLYLDEKGENLFVYRMDYEESYMRPVFYNLKSGEKRLLGLEETYSLNNYVPGLNSSHFFTEDHRFYYVTPEGKVCLNDKIDFATYFNNEDELEDIEFYPVSQRCDGSKIAYAAMVFWGEGWGYYCVSNSDGTSQQLLSDASIDEQYPEWLADGSMVYVGKVELNKNDPDYEEDWYKTKPCINLMDPQGKSVTISNGNQFVVRRTGKPGEKATQGSLEGCEVGLLEHGQVSLYNATTGSFVPLVNETDSVVNGVFVEDEYFYYTVKIGDELYLKRVYLGAFSNTPEMIVDWDLKYNECVSETYGEMSPLIYLPAFSRIGINHNFSWDIYNFADIKFYDISRNIKLDGWNADEDGETDDYDADFYQYEADLEDLTMEDNQYYYLGNDRQVCLTDQIDFTQYVSNPEEYSDPEFYLLSIDYVSNRIAFVALVTWGDLGHGPLCVATLDGKMQQAFMGTDAANLSYGWLSDGSLLFVEQEPTPCVKIVKPDGTCETFSQATSLITK